MPNMELINKVTVGSGGAANIEFTNIPQTYTDLVVMLSGRTTANGDSYGEIDLSFNGAPTGTAYSWRRLLGNGASASSASGSSDDAINLWQITGSGSTASTFGNATYYIPNYTSSNNKSVSADGVTENNSTQAVATLYAGLWASSSAITSLRFTVVYGTSFAEYSTAYLYGVSSAAAGAKATGGIITSDDAYFYHTFTSSGTFTPTQSLTADYLVVAGGGGGGRGDGGGGGAGGLRSTVGVTGGGGSLESPLSLSATGYTVTIGAGGNGASSNGRGNAGSNSVFASITSTGGGGGGGGTVDGGNGGSGGGAAPGRNAGTGTANEGYNGGSAGAYGGGGGGAGETGSTVIGSQGGDGVSISTLATPTNTGVNAYYAGGGGPYVGISGPGKGGLGGGGDGTSSNGTANTGGGGGGWDGSTSSGGTGGSGIVIVRYAR
jgi:hypothetical protein